MSGDVEAVAENLRHSLRLYSLPANVAAYHHPTEDHETVASRVALFLAESLLASDWLTRERQAAHAEALAPIEALADQWERDHFTAFARAIRTALRAQPAEATRDGEGE